MFHSPVNPYYLQHIVIRAGQFSGIYKHTVVQYVIICNTTNTVNFIKIQFLRDDIVIPQASKFLVLVLGIGYWIFSEVTRKP